jgi:hypothetical protein
MELTERQWRMVHHLEESGRRRFARPLGQLLVWLAALLLLGLCVHEGVRIEQTAAEHDLTFQEVVMPQFAGLSQEQAEAKYGAVVSVTLRAALVVIYFFLAAFLASVAMAQRVYNRQDELTRTLLHRLRELDELD